MDDDNLLVFMDETTEDGYQHQAHLIDGFSKDGAPLRRMDLKDWLRATGLRDVMHDFARAHVPDLAAMREAVWAGQEVRAPSEARIAYRLHAGRLHPQEQRGLSQDEAEGYRARLARDGRAARHHAFARKG